VSGTGKRRTRRAEPVEEHNDERWMASYMDMVTVLMCMFIVLFAMSSVDADKFEKLRLSLSTGFGTTVSESVDTAEGIVVPADMIGEDGSLSSLVDETDPDAADATSESDDAEPAETKPPEVQAREELDHLLAIRDQINANLTVQGLEATTTYEITERGLIVRLVGAETFFEGGSIELGGASTQVLGAIGAVLGTIPEELAIEGHADPRGSSAPYPTDWELSSGRATQVVRFLIEQAGVTPTRAGAIGYGSTRPLTPESTPEAIALNRRVDVVVLSSKADEVRELLPEVLEERTTPASVPSH
jgi:chemotaxis protein MotB